MTAKAGVLFVAVTLVLLLLAGCFPMSRPAYEVELYTLDYPPPVQGGARLDQIVRLDRFSVAQAYNSTAMVYSPEAYRLAVYQYNRWRVNPGDIATDYLARDFRSSGLFRAVFSNRQREAARFEVEGSVEEFLESRQTDGWKAALVLEVTLLDTAAPSIDQKVVFQRRYRASEPLSGQTPAAFARGMSACMSRVSAEIINDVARAIAARAAAPAQP